MSAVCVYVCVCVCVSVCVCVCVCATYTYILSPYHAITCAGCVRQFTLVSMHMCDCVFMCSCSKKFVIEQLDGEKVVSRKRGFTVDTCVASARQSEETPSFRFLPVGEKVRAYTPCCPHQLLCPCVSGSLQYSAYSLLPTIDMSLSRSRVVWSCQQRSVCTALTACWGAMGVSA